MWSVWRWKLSLWWCPSSRHRLRICSEAVRDSTEAHWGKTQTSIAQFLQGHIPSTIQLTERPCRDKVEPNHMSLLSQCLWESADLPYVIVSKWLPGNSRRMHSWLECSQRLSDYSFIQCTDTKSLLFPLLSCCAELQSMQSPAPESRNTVTVLVVCFVLLVVVTAIGSATVIIYLVLSKRRSRARAKTIQMDIMSSRYYTCYNIHELVY